MRPQALSLLLGLSLSGVVIGVDLETERTLHEITLSEEAYSMVRFRTWDGWAHPVRNYRNPRSFTLQWLTFAREDFEFLGAKWRYGIGFGAGARAENVYIQSLDSAFFPVTNIQVFPVLAIFTQIYSSESEGLKLIGSLDTSNRFPASGQVVFCIAVGL